jgi:hypothetical protein
MLPRPRTATQLRGHHPTFLRANDIPGDVEDVTTEGQAFGVLGAKRRSRVCAGGLGPTGAAGGQAHCSTSISTSCFSGSATHPQVKAGSEPLPFSSVLRSDTSGIRGEAVWNPASRQSGAALMGTCGILCARTTRRLIPKCFTISDN